MGRRTARETRRSTISNLKGKGLVSVPGHIVDRRKDGRGFVLRLYRGTEDGRKREISRSFDTEIEVKEAQRQLSSHVLTHALQLGPYGDPNGRFGTYLKDWLKRQQQLAPASFERAESVVRRVNADQIAALRYSRLTPRILEDYYGRLEKSGLSSTTIRRHHAVIRKALNDGMREEIFTKHPGGLVKLPRVDPTEVVVLSEAEVLLILSEPSRFQPLYRFAASIVSREGEVLGLPWTQVFLDKCLAMFTQALQQSKGGGYILKEPKTPRSRRTHPLTTEIVTLLREVQAAQERERTNRLPCPRGEKCRERTCQCWHETGLVFTLVNGKPIHKRNLVRDLHEICDRLGLSVTRPFHAFRHFAASYLLANNVPVRDVMELGGWTSAAFFLKQYAHAMPGGHEKTVSVMSQLLSQQPSRPRPVNSEGGKT